MEHRVRACPLGGMDLRIRRDGADDATNTQLGDLSEQLADASGSRVTRTQSSRWMG
jgi:hypothetical protein